MKRITIILFLLILTLPIAAQKKTLELGIYGGLQTYTKSAIHTKTHSVRALASVLYPSIISAIVFFGLPTYSELPMMVLN